MDINAFLEVYGLAAVFGVTLLKAIGLPIPIPADVLMLAVSAQVVAGGLDLPTAFGALLVALAVGGTIQFMLVRGIGRGLLLRFGRYLGITEARLDTASRRLAKGGVLGIGVAILTPGIRSIAVPACGLARIPLSRFVSGLTLGSALFLGLHFALGILGGSLLSQVSLTVSPALLAGIVVVLLALGFGAWYIIRRRQRPHEPVSQTLAAAAGAWHEAVCPVCLALGAMERLQIDAAHPATGEAVNGEPHAHGHISV